MGEGAQQRGYSRRPEEVHAREGPQTLLAEEVGRRADIFLVGAEQEDEPMDYERLPESSEAFIYAAMSRLMARRLARR